MRWFKHFSDNHRGRTVQTLLDEMGHDGVFIYYVIMEMCAEKIEKPKEKALSEGDFLFTFHRRTIENGVRCKWVRIEKCLTCVALAGLLQWHRDGELVEIKMPILLDLLDRDLKGPRSRRVQDAKTRRLESESESESDIYKEKHKDGAAVLFFLWNQNKGGLASAEELTKARKEKAKARWKECSSVETWVQVITTLSASPFCNGENDSGWKATFDFLLRPETRTKTLEGTYSNKLKKQIGFGMVDSL